jgi:spore coat protein SA
VRGGAVEQWVQELTARLGRPGRTLAVISRPAEAASTDAPRLSNVRYIGIPWTTLEKACHGLKDALSHRNPLRHLAKIQNVWSYGRRAARLAREFDLVYLHNEPNILLFLSRRAGQKIVLHMHNDHLTIPLFRPAYRRALAKADLVLCVSDFIRRRAIEAFPQYADRFRVMLNATDTAVFKPYGTAAATLLPPTIQLGAERHILYVGRLTPIKGVHVLITAFREILVRHPAARLVIAGSSFFEGATRTPYEAELAELAAPVGNAITFTGYLPHASLKYLYCACDVVVVPSLWEEPFGLVVVEAMASGTCVVASSVGGLPEIITDRQTGLLAPPGDARALADCVSRLLGDPQYKLSLETAALQSVAAGFTWDRLANAIESTLAQLT